MPNTGLFYLYEVVSETERATAANSAQLKVVRAECLTCRCVFTASGPPSLVNLPGGGAILQCPGCPVHQAIAAARFADFMERFPAGSTSTPT